MIYSAEPVFRCPSATDHMVFYAMRPTPVYSEMDIETRTQHDLFHYITISVLRQCITGNFSEFFLCYPIDFHVFLMYNIVVILLVANDMDFMQSIGVGGFVCALYQGLSFVKLQVR